MSTKKLGICVKTDIHEGNFYSIILHSELGENVIYEKKISIGKWVLFLPTDENIFIECKYKRLVDSNNFEITSDKRPVMPIEQTIQVLALINNSEYLFNEQFILCKDELLGRILVGKFDSFINKSFGKGDKIENYATNIHWVGNCC
ncbi:hypothetical protein Mgra_00003298 [Meloidogyne graminicola]|uniref:Uncharacterized protein n=1 Tax=Meloidogyne graminicola TaxID=189291 RepID=A0A8S9ZUR6_9BILA|nr:hypothetical protein Mgra_00003298 [Meloidogyne graminicola]